MNDGTLASLSSLGLVELAGNYISNKSRGIFLEKVDSRLFVGQHFVLDPRTLVVAFHESSDRFSNGVGLGQSQGFGLSFECLDE